MKAILDLKTIEVISRRNTISGKKYTETIGKTKAYNTEGREAEFIQINKEIDKMVGDKKFTEDVIKKAEFIFMLDLKTLIANSNTDAELNQDRDAMRRAEQNTAPEPYRPAFEKVGTDIH